MTITCEVCDRTFVRAESYLRKRANAGNQVRLCSPACRNAITHTWVTSKGFRAGRRDDLPHVVRSSWEANFARVLNAMHIAYEFEPKTFHMGETYYTPDFRVDGRYWVEVKGWMRPAAAAKIEAFRVAFPDEVLVVVDAPVYRAIEREWADRLPLWERPASRGSRGRVSLLN